ncbi:MAG: radical SAM protein [Candidatus Diapherotrites archaeon]
MRILLMVPPLRTNLRDGKKSAINLGLWYLGSYLEKMGNEVKIIDCALEGWENVREWKGIVIEYGLSDREIISEVVKFYPELIGVVSQFTVGYTAFLNLVKLLKKNFVNVPIIAGGPHATALPEMILRDSEGTLDYIVYGEGEITFNKIVKKIMKNEKINGLKGICFLDEKNNFVKNPPAPLIENLDSIGQLNPELIEHIPMPKEPNYTGSSHGRKYIDVMWSRGCPNNCGFCFSPQMWRRCFRKHSKKYIGEQLGILKDAGYEEVIIQDDNFSRGKGWALEVMELIKEKGFHWQNNGGLEMEDLTPEMVKFMASTNCTTLFIPLNLRTNKTNRIPRELKVHYEKILKTAKDGGLYVFSSMILGFPEQTMKSMREQVKYAKFLREKGYSDFHIIYAFSVLPGTTRWYEVMEPAGNGQFKVKKGSGVRFAGGWRNWPRYSINTPQIGSRNFSFREFEKLFYQSYYEINGDEKAKAWLYGREWVKI